MTETTDPLLERVRQGVGKPISSSGPAVAPDEVNLAMIRHWVDALDDRNPVYLDEAVAAKTRFKGIVAPPAMLQTWTMARPRIEGIAARGGSADEIEPDSPIAMITAGGYPGTLATNSELEFVRYLRVGDRIAVRDRAGVGLGAQGHRARCRLLRHLGEHVHRPTRRRRWTTDVSDLQVRAGRGRARSI